MTAAMYNIGIFKQPFLEKMLFAFCCFACFCSMSSLSQAVEFRPDSPIKDPQIQSWLNVANNYWSQYPNCPNGIWIGVWEKPKPSNGVAQATIGGCEIWLSPKWWPANTLANDQNLWKKILCNSLTHEYGHLLGYQHSKDKHNVMYEAVQFNVPACNFSAEMPAKVGQKGRIADLDADFVITNFSSQHPLVRIITKNKSKFSASNVKLCVRWGPSRLKLTKHFTTLQKQGKNCFVYKSIGASQRKTLVLAVEKKSKDIPKLSVYTNDTKIIGD